MNEGQTDLVSERVISSPIFTTLDQLTDAYDQQFPDLVPTVKRSDNLDDLFLAQMRENLKFGTGQDRFLTRQENNSLAYSLPCDLREVDGQYQIFIPRVRYLTYSADPKIGSHPPFEESYGYNRNSYRSDFERIVGCPIDEFTDRNVPIWIGNKPEETNPYHRIIWTGSKLVLELSSQPNLEQQEKILALKARLSAKLTMEVAIKDKETNKQYDLPTIEQAVSKVALPEVYLRQYNLYPQENSHEIEIVNGKLIVKTRPGTHEAKFVYGFGVFRSQLDEITEQNSPDFMIVFSPSAHTHSEAKADYILDDLTHTQSVKDPTKNEDPFEVRRRLEEQLTQGESVALNWPHREEIIDSPLPFQIEISGRRYACGVRAMIDLSKKMVSLDLLVSQKDYHDPIAKALLERLLKVKVTPELKEFYGVDTMTKGQMERPEEIQVNLLPIHLPKSK